MNFDLNTDVPLLLLPVRLETRFRGNTLLIRVYPDTVHVDSFEPRLTKAEIQWGQRFWQQTWLAQNEDQERNAWAQLAQVFGPRRAAWIAKEVAPTNPGDRLAKKPPMFPTPPASDPKTPHTPCTELLPDYWVASGTFSYEENGQSKSSSFLERGRDVKYANGSDRIFVMPRLDQGLAPEQFKNDPHVGWLVNFDKAEDIGLGLRIPLLGANWTIQQLFVYGVKASLKPQGGKERLEKLLDAHHYTQGLAFVRQGTPTNNTSTAPSGYSSGDPGSVESFQIERRQQASTADRSNLKVMAKALGINPTFLTKIRDANTVEQQSARDMNDVLWENTWGYFLNDMLALKSTHSGEIEQMRQHFVEFVRARGPLPGLRIGSQPYGVLPVLALGKPGSDAMTTGPVACLRALREIWGESLQREDLVPRLKKGSDISLTLLQVLAMAPTGVSYVGRPCTRIVPVSASTTQEALEKTGQTPLPSAIQKALDAFLGPNAVTPHQRTVFASQSSLRPMGRPLIKDNTAQAPPVVSLYNVLRDKNKTAKSLSELSEADLELVFKETLDVCSHRLDAWITSLATKRLHDLRNPPPTQPPTPPPIGLSIGGYGWVENLKPDQGNNNKDPDAYIHAPSLAHATTAAVLRSGYLSRKLSETLRDSNALAINLSSERVRLALHLIDGVRGGQSLGTLLGYRFERDLHEHGHDSDIPAFRLLAPGSAELVSTEALSDAAKAKLQHLVLDGWKLFTDYYEDTHPQNPPAPKKIPSELVAKCQGELERLIDAVDAVADLALAESVHQVAQGNPVRAGATLEAIARGEAPPPELDFIRTPRTGINHTHRISVIFGTPPAVFPWGITTPRAQAEPVLNAWVAQLLGPGAEEAACTVKYTDPMVNGEQTLPVKIKDLNFPPEETLKLAPLDLVYLLEGEQGGKYSEIEQRIVYHVQKTKPSVTITSLDFARPPGDTSLHIGEVLEITRSIRRLITGARALESRDVDLPEHVDIDEASPPDPALIKRATDARDTFIKATKTLRDLLPEKPDAPLSDPPAVRTALNGLASYGLMGSIPVIPPHLIGNTDDATKHLHAQARVVLGEAQARQKRAQAGPALIQTNAQAVAVLKELFGEDFRVLPAFTPENGKDLNQTFAKSTALQGGKPLASITWFQRIARVRDGAARLDATMQYAEALNRPLLSFQVGQLPSRDGEQWLALENPPQGNRLSLACVTTVTDFTKPVAGLLVDEWVETVPNKEEVTGLAFHYDAPQPRAPQALLLAMAPDGVKTWDSTTLENTLRETLELAKLRAVDLTALGVVGQYLPAMYFQHDQTTRKSPFADT